VTSRDDDDVPRLPRSRGFKLSRRDLARVAMTAVLLAMVIVVARPCADAVSSFVTGFGGDDSASKQMPRPGTVDQPAATTGSAGDYEQLRPDMTEAELKAAIERAKARANPAGSAGSARAAGSDAGRP
jgi:hypothetical protein